MRTLSKSKLLAFRQCPKRLWLTVNRPELLEESAQTQSGGRTGHEVGEVARRLYDSAGKGVLIDVQAEGFEAAMLRSQALLASSQPLFEAGFTANGASAFADVMLPVRRSAKRAWRLVEVKSSASVKDDHRDDVAIQAFVARAAGVPLASVAVAHIDSSWVYPGNGRYEGLLKEVDLTDETLSRNGEVAGWIAQAEIVAGGATEPKRGTGRHCTEPYECGFLKYCRAKEPQPKHPVTWLPRIAAKALKAHIDEDGVTEMRHVRDDLLNERQLRVKQHTLSGKTYFDSAGAAAALAGHRLPAVFLDFETISFAVPIWKGTRPFQQIPFQFSTHTLRRSGSLEHASFLDLSGNDPSRTLAEALIEACGGTGPVFAYSAAFENSRIKELAGRFPRLGKPLRDISNRIVDLLPVAEQHYYHPSQEGSWSIKSVLPAVAPDLRYDDIEGVQDGGMAMEAYREAIDPGTPAVRKDEIQRHLIAYCRLDTFAMVRLWAFFTGRPSPQD